MYDIVVGRSAKDKEKYGLKGTVLIAKHYVKMGQTTSLANKVYLDVTRSHVLFICGKRGGGKCLTGDTLITLDDGSEVPIKDLLSDSYTVGTLNDSLKICGVKKEGFYKRQVSKLLRIKLRTGKELKLTPEHPLLTVEGWIKAEDLNLKSRVATPRKLPFFGDFLLSEAEVKLLSYFIAEGHISNGFALFSNKDEIIVDDFLNAIKTFDENLIVKNHSSDSDYRVIENKPRRKKVIKRNEKGQILNSISEDFRSSIVKWLDGLNLYGKLSHEKFIPEIIFKSTKSNISLFLNRLFSCDGTIYQEGNRWRISYCSNSKVLITQVQSLLLRFGIVSKIRSKITKCRDAYELEIFQEFIETFLQEISFLGKKETRAKLAIKECLKIKRNTNVDTIPKEVWTSFHPENWAELGRKLGYSHPKSIRESVRYFPSRQKLQSIALASNDSYLATLAESDIFWDEVVSIEELEGIFDVYDITVPETHNFVANNVIVHNSYTMGVIAEGLSDVPKEIANNLSIILVDTMGIYWTMKYPNLKDEDLLKEWGLEPKGLDVRIFTPEAFYHKYKEQGIPTDVPFSLAVSELRGEDWCLAFDFSINDEYGVLIDKVVAELFESDEPYDLDDIISQIRKDDSSKDYVKAAVINHINNAKTWGLFSKNGTHLKDLVTGGQVTVLDVSCYATMPNGWNVKALVLGLMSQKLFVQRMISRKDEEFADINNQVHSFGREEKPGKQEPLVWIVVDEAHEFLPREGKTAASDPLITILREGRQPGISLILATQQPGKIHTDVMTQSDTVLAHRITAKMDVDALSMLMQSYMRTGLDTELDNLPRFQGAGVIFDDTNEKMFPIRIRPRITWHGGESPNAIPKGKKLEDF